MGFINKLIYIFILSNVLLLADEHIPVSIPVFPHIIKPKPEVPEIPKDKVNPVLKKEEDRNRVLEKMDTVMLKVATSVYVPLEIISDVEIEATVVDDQEVTIPFNIEVNKQPDKRDYYRVKFSEESIDIDKDGVVDTQIYSTKYINSKISDGNFVNIKGSGISNEGTFYKKVYLTVEVK